MIVQRRLRARTFLKSVTTEIKGANLFKVGDDLFSIVIIENQLMKSYPFGSIISVTEGINGASSGDKEEKATFPIIIQVYHAGF